jgi:hypothetical protein
VLCADGTNDPDFSTAEWSGHGLGKTPKPFALG